MTSESGDCGVQHGAHLRALTEAAIRNEWSELPAIYSTAKAAMGEQAVVDTLVVASAFNGITRVADATGIPLDDSTREATVQLREDAGIEQFAYAAKSARYGKVLNSN